MNTSIFPFNAHLKYLLLHYNDSIVMEALKKVSPDRKCFRTIGGVLVERTVKEVFPALKLNSEQVLASLSAGLCQ